MAITKISPSVVDFDANITISTADNLDTLTLTSTDADASVGPTLALYRNSSSPADSDIIGSIDFDGRNDNSQDVQYSRIISQVADASDGTEDATLYIQTIAGGTNQDRITIKSSETVFNEDSSDIDFRVESNGNTAALFVDAGNDKVTTGVRFDFADLLIGTGAGKYIQVTGGSSNALAIGMDGGTAAPGTASTSMGFHHWNNSAWSNVMNVTRDGLAFGTDTAAANALDDYEEGTWTPNMIAGGSISINKATYTKIGRTVFYYAYVSVTTPNNTSQFSLGGLPYNALATNYYPAGSIGYVNDKDITGTLGPIVATNSNYVYFQRYDGNGNSVKNNGAFYNSGSSLYLIISGTYEAQ